MRKKGHGRRGRGCSDGGTIKEKGGARYESA